ncbi:DUF937 domain-containing protein [Roseitalea porphyridii]|uniref:DUF937 domain-containing protein n=1 Tax=Roseitalea porphyridii TaxID=1852022 RepID=A0A4P6UWR6_9HYPH|nr:DUF937 domain-containing protein [Roseitalea porphyridii]QBK29541.1 DUF937 domain-containing protein [Roseitalea porphyridii]
MMTLFETLTRAQDGEAIKAMARQFGLSEQQTEQAIEALMPAFSAGLKRNASDPMGVAGFMQALSTGQHAKYFEDVHNAFAPQGVKEGNGILGHLFGSKEVSRAVAAQAEQATGVGQEILKQMLPVVAATLMGGLFKQSTGQVAPSRQAASPMARMMEQFMAAQGQPSQGASGNPFAEMVAQMFGGDAAAARPAPEAMADNPWGRLFTEMMGGGPSVTAPEKNGNAYEELFGQMFETGRQTQDSYQRGIEDIFDSYLRGMIKSR